MNEIEIIQQLSDKISETTSSLCGLTARIDERTKSVVERQAEHDKKLDNIVDDAEELKLKVALLEKSQDGVGAKIKLATDFFIKLLWVIVACYILFKLGLNTPPLP